MITRAHAKSHHSLEVIEKKRDPSEVTFRTTTEFLPFRRTVIRYRYVTDIPAVHGYTTRIDYERVHGHLQEVALDYDDSAPCVSTTPALLCQTTVRLHHGDLKQLVMHLYWTNGNILVQGRKSRNWVQDEFKRLQAVVRILAESVSLTSTDAASAWNQASIPPPPLRVAKEPEGVDATTTSSTRDCGDVDVDATTTSSTSDCGDVGVDATTTSSTSDCGDVGNDITSTTTNTSCLSDCGDGDATTSTTCDCGDVDVDAANSTTTISPSDCGAWF